MNSAADFCRHASSAAGEGLAGEGTGPASTWIFVEDESPWGAKVPAETGMSSAWKDALARYGKAADVKLILIRRPKRLHNLTASVGRQIVVWHVDFTGGRRISARVDDPAEFVACDWVAQAKAAPHVSAENLEIFVCTHGTRDRCCAKWGMPVFEATNAILGNNVWQTSHIGGHRFAATALAFPLGFSFGRLEEGEVERWLRALREGRVEPIDRVRGRVFLSPVAQVAELTLLAQGQVRASEIAAIAVKAADVHSEATISLHGRPDIHAFAVMREALTTATIGSCGDEEARPAFAMRAHAIQPV